MDFTYSSCVVREHDSHEIFLMKPSLDLNKKFGLLREKMGYTYFSLANKGACDNTILRERMGILDQMSTKDKYS